MYFHRSTILFLLVSFLLQHTHVQTTETNWLDFSADVWRSAWAPIRLWSQTLGVFLGERFKFVFRCVSLCVCAWPRFKWSGTWGWSPQVPAAELNSSHLLSPAGGTHRDADRCTLPETLMLYLLTPHKYTDVVFPLGNTLAKNVWECCAETR